MTEGIDPLALQRLREAIDTDFDVEVNGNRCTLRLKLVAIHVRDAAEGYEQFAAHFLGPSDPLLPQATYAFRHQHLGAFPLFIVPLGREDAGVRYEACVIRHA